MTDLQTVFPDTEITVNGESLVIKPFTFGQLPKVMKLSTSFYGVVQPLFEEGAPSEVEAIIKVMAYGGADLIELVALGIGKPTSWFDKLSIDDGIKVTAAFLEVNLSFFAQRVMPQIKASTTHLQSLATDMQSLT